MKTNDICGGYDFSQGEAENYEYHFLKVETTNYKLKRTSDHFYMCWVLSCDQIKLVTGEIMPIRQFYIFPPPQLIQL